mmetsp:Transcript_23484/g.42366  ORF Transcript_23484/g.42366 Transcript_23484/m.42366 type:complete len:110 (+) Transcript_23484:356-685(+)
MPGEGASPKPCTKRSGRRSGGRASAPVCCESRPAWGNHLVPVLEVAFSPDDVPAAVIAAAGEAVVKPNDGIEVDDDKDGGFAGVPQPARPLPGPCEDGGKAGRATLEEL